MTQTLPTILAADAKVIATEADQVEVSFTDYCPSNIGRVLIGRYGAENLLHELASVLGYRLTPGLAD